MANLSASDLKELRKLTIASLLERAPSQREKHNLKCRNVFRIFSDNDLFKFFSVIRPKEAKFGVGFFLQLTGGFRVGEVAGLTASSIDFERGVVSLLTEKARVNSDQPLPAIALDVLREWLIINHDQITNHNNFLFFSENPFVKRDFVSPLVFRNYFQVFRNRAALNSTYAERSDTNNPLFPTNVSLYKLTTHSFRRNYLTTLYKECKQRELVKVLARHQQREAIDSYIHFSHTEQLELVNKVFNREPFETIAKELIEKMKL